MKTIQDTLFVNSTREMVSLSFELDKEGSGIIFFSFSYARDKSKYFSPYFFTELKN